MPQILIAAAAVAGAWLAARALRALAHPQTKSKPVGRDGDQQMRTLRQDPSTGVYRPED